MQDGRTIDVLKQALQTAGQAGQARSSVMQELVDDAPDQVTGAGNPFDGIPRPDLQPIGPGCA